MNIPKKKTRVETLFSQESNKKQILSGNEAFTRGLIEAGTQFLANYPGTPTSEIGDLWEKFAVQDNNIFYDLSVNETIAFESAVGASWSGIRSAVIFKHLGMNLIMDALHSAMYSGLDGNRKAGLIIICGADPDITSSTNAADIRMYSLHSKLPIIEPSSIQECLDFVAIAYNLSEFLQIPVMLYSTSYLNHASGIVHLHSIKKKPVILEKRYFIKNFDKYLNAIHWAKKNQIKLNQLLKSQEMNTKSIFPQIMHQIEGKQNLFLENEKDRQKIKIAFVSSGLGWTYLEELCRSLATNIPRLRLIQTYPVNRATILHFIKHYSPDLLIIIEELEAFLELQIKTILYDNQISIPIIGKNYFPQEGALSSDLIMHILGQPLEIGNIQYSFALFQRNIKNLPSELLDLTLNLPIREPSFCAGCAHRNTFYALKQAANNYQKKTGIQPIYGGDIGCYTLGMSKPYEVMDWLICMGAGVGIANGVARMIDPKQQHVIAIIGDSTLFHSGLQALYNLTKANVSLTILILDNYYSAMTGQQISPSTPLDLIPKSNIHTISSISPFSIKKLIHSLGDFPLIQLNGYSIKKMIKQFYSVFAKNGTKFVLVEAECALEKLRRVSKSSSKVKLYISEHCNQCNECFEHLGCTAIESSNDQYYIDNSKCLGGDCLSCLEVCPNHAIFKTEINPHKNL